MNNRFGIRFRRSLVAFGVEVFFCRIFTGVLVSLVYA
jgi:hypothetical protein